VDLFPVLVLDAPPGWTMVKFKLHQRIRINNPLPDKEGMTGWVGTVVRLRRADDAAWVNMTRDLPLRHQSFPKDDDRHRHLMLWPDECKPVEPSTRIDFVHTHPTRKD
jgi:hypothetical protein